MKKSMSLLIGIAFIFSFNMNALADEGHDHGQDESIKQAAEKFRKGDGGSATEQEDKHHSEESKHQDSAGHSDHSKDMEHHEEGTKEHEDNMSHEEHGSGLDGGADTHDGKSSHNSKTHSEHDDESATHVEQGGEHEHSATDKAVDSSPNYKVLGAFGTINLSFILIGIWNKWMRRKGE